MLMVAESFRARGSCISWGVFNMGLKFWGFLAIRSEALCLGLSEPAGRLVCSVRHALCFHISMFSWALLARARSRPGWVVHV